MARTRLLRTVVCLAALLALAAAPGGAGAATTSIDFESPALASGTLVTTQFGGVTFYSGGSPGASQLPVVDTAGHARSVTHALDITQEPGASSFRTPASAARSAPRPRPSSLWASSVNATVNLRLDLYNAGGAVVGTSGNVAVGATYVQLTASSLAFDVARFVVSNQSGAAGQQPGIYVDDLSFDNGVAPADFSLGAPAYAGVAHGSSVDVPLTITRLNGSVGNVTFTFPGLPPDLVATATPNPSSSGAAVLTISSSLGSSYTGTRTINVLGTPANAAAGPTARTVALAVEVTNAVTWSPQPVPTITLAPCSSAQQSFTALYGTAFHDAVDVSAFASPGLTASVLPPSFLTSGTGTLTVERGDDTTPAGFGSFAGVRGASAGTAVPRGTLTFPVAFSDPALTSAPTVFSTPQGERASTVTFRGTGLCPGSTVAFGNAAATATAATVTAGAFTVPVPRLASDGPITITSPGGRVLTTAAAQVRTYRNTNGFSFPNRGWSPSINGEVDAWGPNQVWLNLCPIPGCFWLADGTPSVEYGLFSLIGAPILASGNGSCFGFSLASRRLARREGPSPSFLHGSETVWQVPLDRTIPHTEHFAFEDGHPEKLIDYIWGQHMLQLSSESLHLLLVHSLQLATGEVSASDLHGQLTAAFALGERPLVIIPNGLAGHVVVAYDVDETPWPGSHRGDYRILVYDNNYPFTSDENSDAGLHAQNEGGSYLEIHQDGSWVFPNLTDHGVPWHGTRLDPYLVEERSFPVHPTMPLSLDGLATLIVSGSGRATPDAAAKAARMPILDAPAGKNLPDAFVADPRRAVTLTATPDAHGDVKIGAIGPGVLAQVNGAGKGAFALDARGAGAAWSPRDGAGPLDLTLGRLARGGVFREVELTSGASGGDHVMLGPSGALAIAHTGAPSLATLRLTVDGGALGSQTFTSAPFRLAAGTTTVRADWAHLGTTTPGMTAGGRNGSLRSAGARARVLAIGLTGTRRGARVTATVHARAAGGQAVASVLVLRGRRVVASGTARIRGGVAHVAIALPRSARKLHLSLRTIVVVSARGRPLASRSATAPLHGAP